MEKGIDIYSMDGRAVFSGSLEACRNFIGNDSLPDGPVCYDEVDSWREKEKYVYQTTHGMYYTYVNLYLNPDKGW